MTAAAILGELTVFVVIGSLAIAGPVIYYLLGGEGAKTRLDEMKDWLAVHNNAIMAVLFLVFGANLIAKGLPPLTEPSTASPREITPARQAAVIASKWLRLVRPS